MKHDLRLVQRAMISRLNQVVEVGCDIENSEIKILFKLFPNIHYRFTPTAMSNSPLINA